MAHIDTELDHDILDDVIEAEPPRGPRRQRRLDPSPDETGSVGDPRLLVPLALLLAAVFVIFLAWQAGSGDDPVSDGSETQSNLVERVAAAELRAGFDAVNVREDGSVIVLEGEAESSAVATAIGAVARSVEGVSRVDNRLVIVGGAIEFAPEDTAGAATSESLTDRLAAAGNITFEPGLASPTTEGLITIDAVAALLFADPGTAVEVHGHTDSDGDTAANEQLSQDRAEAVIAALAARGVDPARLEAVGFGESQPVAPNITAEGRAENRRIEFVLAD